MICPICKKSVAWDGNRWRPFCSERCHLSDLGAWAGEAYRVPGQSLLVPPSELEDREDSQ